MSKIINSLTVIGSFDGLHFTASRHAMITHLIRFLYMETCSVIWKLEMVIIEKGNDGSQLFGPSARISFVVRLLLFVQKIGPAA